MKKHDDNEQMSGVYRDRPEYADYSAPEKFMAIDAIIAKRLIEHPNAMCSYSGGSDSDIMLDMIERVRKLYGLPPVYYVFFNTGLEMEATKRHVKEVAEKYGVEIHTHRPKKGIVTAVRENGIPFISKIVSYGLNIMQDKNIPISIHEEYWAAEDKAAKRAELKERYPKSEDAINFVCSCNSKGTPFLKMQIGIDASAYLYDFIKENPVPFRVSNVCCNICKKQPAHELEKRFEMDITGERMAEGGTRAVMNGERLGCFYQKNSGVFRLRPLFYVSDADKAWYKEYYHIRYSDAYEVYGLKRTGCCGCAISARAAADLEIIRPYEPQLVKAAWAVFGDSYRYRAKYDEYRRKRNAEKNAAKNAAKNGQMPIPMFAEEEDDDG